MGFLIRFFYNLLCIGLRIVLNDREGFGKYNLVFTVSESIPYVFWNYIFVNQKEYQNRQIKAALLTHEIAHAQERHSLDVIIVELLQIVFWFNPLIYFYKRAIQLNHEFIADQYVLQRHQDVRSYQSLLLEKAHLISEMSLVSNLNFYITKQRLEMMTKYTSIRRSFVYMTMTSLLFMGLIFGFAKTKAQPNNAEGQLSTKSISKDDYFKNATFNYRDKEGTQVFVSYDMLEEAQKSMIPPPPPHPGGHAITPLLEGTVVKMEGRSMRITGDGWNPKPPAPPAPPRPVSTPPAPPVPPRAIGAAPSPPAPPRVIGAPPSPPAPLDVMAPPAPRVPPAPQSPYEYVQEVSALGATFYLNGTQISSSKAIDMTKDTDSVLTIRSKKVNGKMSIYLKK